MGVDYNAVLGVGMRYGSKAEVEDFLRVQGKITDDMQQELESGYDIEEVVSDDLEVTCMDCYSGNDYFVGYRVRAKDPRVLLEQVKGAVEAWERNFTVPATVTLDVKFS